MENRKPHTKAPLHLQRTPPNKEGIEPKLAQLSAEKNHTTTTAERQPSCRIQDTQTRLQQL